MHFHQNHSWCSRSNWNNQSFDSSYMVSFGTHLSYQHNNDEYVEDLVDWNNLVVEEDEVFIQEDYDRAVAWAKKSKHEYSPDYPTLAATKYGVPNLKPEVLQWLHENVKDCASNKEQPQGWAIGNESYRATNTTDITIWFYRRGDAMKFIKEWSQYKKPTTYLNYFKDDYRELYDGKLRVFNRSDQDFEPKVKGRVIPTKKDDFGFTIGTY